MKNNIIRISWKTYSIQFECQASFPTPRMRLFAHAPAQLAPKGAQTVPAFAASMLVMTEASQCHVESVLNTASFSYLQLVHMIVTNNIYNYSVMRFRIRFGGYNGRKEVSVC